MLSGCRAPCCPEVSDTTAAGAVSQELEKSFQALPRSFGVHPDPACTEVHDIANKSQAPGVVKREGSEPDPLDPAGYRDGHGSDIAGGTPPRFGYPRVWHVTSAKTKGKPCTACPRFHAMKTPCPGAA